MLIAFLHWFVAVRAALVVEGPEIRQRNAARKRSKKVSKAQLAGRTAVEKFVVEPLRLVAQSDPRCPK
jgi:hypothetical protein